MRPPRTRSTVTPDRIVFAATVIVSFAACGSDATGPEQPIDGEWEMLGLFSGFELQIECWLTGNLTLASDPSGANTITGTGTHVLDCRTEDARPTIERTAPILNGRYTGEQLGITLGFCTLGATYQRNRPNVMTGGVATCNVFVTGFAQVAVIGSWEAVRVSTP